MKSFKSFKSIKILESSTHTRKPLISLKRGHQQINNTIPLATPSSSPLKDKISKTLSQHNSTNRPSSYEASNTNDQTLLAYELEEPEFTFTEDQILSPKGKKPYIICHRKVQKVKG
jgi:hypothetical protein